MASGTAPGSALAAAVPLAVWLHAAAAARLCLRRRQHLEAHCTRLLSSVDQRETLQIRHRRLHSHLANKFAAIKHILWNACHLHVNSISNYFEYTRNNRCLVEPTVFAISSRHSEKLYERLTHSLTPETRTPISPIKSLRAIQDYSLWDSTLL